MKVRRPNGFFYLLVYILIYPILKIFFGMKVNKEYYRPCKGPFIVVCNHVSFMDFLMVMLTIYPRRLNAVTALKFFCYRPLNWFLPVMGCIPKNLFDADVRAIMGVRTVLKRGGRILLFPEGRCTVAGDFMGMHKATGKLVKKLGVPVISCRLEGSYICMPFWRKGIRFGQTRVTLSNLFSAGDTKSLTVEEINRMIGARLSGEDGLPAKPLRTWRARRLAEGLENILYRCTACHREFTLISKGNIMTCTACGDSLTLNRTGLDAVQDRYREISRYETGRLSGDMEPVSVQVSVRMPLTPGRGIGHCGRGELSLTPKGWYYDGELHGEQVELHFPIESVPALPFDPKDSFQIYGAGKFYSFTPIGNPQACAKYATIGECAYWRFSQNIQMTPGANGGFAESMEVRHDPELDFITAGRGLFSKKSGR
jgi:1-acyl-sn-glycerol-3-phosphate acyltransferase